MRIYLIGYSYGGKTTMGRQLASMLGYNHFDTDKAIEIKYHTSISMLINHYSEEAFRIIEKQVLHSTAELDNVVISTGGGTACNDENIRFLLDHGVVVHMQMTIDDIIERMKTSRRSRPLLSGLNDSERRLFISKHLAERMPYYSLAPISIKALNATPEEIISLIREYQSQASVLY